MIPIDCESKESELKTISAATKPQIRGWYNGRNETVLHKAITVSREVKNVKNYVFTTLLFPVEKIRNYPLL